MYLLIPWCRILFEKLIVAQLIKKYPTFFMEAEGSSPYSQKPAMDPMPSQLNPVLPIDPYIPKVQFNVILPPTHLRLPCGLFPSSLPTKTLSTSLLSPMRATCPAHFTLLDLITLTILDKEYRL
jgi:hypothetical protein